jgi:hypothetical protein
VGIFPRGNLSMLKELYTISPPVLAYYHVFTVLHCYATSANHMCRLSTGVPDSDREFVLGRVLGHQTASGPGHLQERRVIFASDGALRLVDSLQEYFNLRRDHSVSFRVVLRGARLAPRFPRDMARTSVLWDRIRIVAFGRAFPGDRPPQS